VRKPTGALTKAKAAAAPRIYLAYPDHRYRPKGVDSTVEFWELDKNFWWPANKKHKPKGYVFDNYLHALAYSLKVKAKHGRR